MPYYVYTIKPGPTPLIKDLDKIDQFEKFKDAKLKARDMRSQMAEGADLAVKVIFAESALEAEEKLMETRDAPILREWEK